MNRYQLANAIEKVDGYYLSVHPTAKPQEEFVKAQAECARHLRAQLGEIESLTFEQFAASRKNKIVSVA